MNKIYFNNEIYNFKAIQSAVLDYSSLAEITINSANNGWECSFSACRHDTVQTIKEFANYCIDLMVSGENDDY